MIKQFKKSAKFFFVLIFFMSGCVNTNNKYNNHYLLNNSYNYNFKTWNSKDESKFIVLAVHGFNDYSNSFLIPAQFFSQFQIKTISFDLRGFGSNQDSKSWFPVEVHIFDLKKIILKLRRENPEKKIFLLGESMGGAILLNLVSQEKYLPIEGIILVAPAIWNFSELNPIKSFILKSLSKLFPKLNISGKGLVKVKASDNIEMLKQLSKDKYFIHKPNLESIYGITVLMDLAFKSAKNYLKNPSYDTLIIVPLLDEIIPRKPIKSLFSEYEIRENIEKKVDLAVYDKNYHMILRDLDGNRVIREIKEWIFDRKRIKDLYSFKMSLARLESSQYIHQLD